MKKSNMRKRIISVTMVLVMCLVFVMPVTASSTELPTWDFTGNFSSHHMLVGDVAYFAEEIDNDIERAAFSISNVSRFDTITRPVIWEGEHIGYQVASVVFAYAPAVVTILQSTETTGWGANFGRFDAPNPDLPFNGSVYILGVTTGVKVPSEYGGYFTEAGATYVLPPGTYLFSSNWDGSTLFLIVQDDTADTTQPPPEPTAQPSPWAVEEVARAIELGLVPQNLQSNYTQATTRAEFAALVVTLYETVTGREIAIDRSIAFSDTTDINVHKAATIGVVTGVGDNRFAPDSSLTREQAAVMLARLAYAIGQPFPESAPTFADNADVSYWAIDAVGRVQAAGIMGGVGDNRFAPRGDYTREQSIVTILRLFDILDSMPVEP